MAFDEELDILLRARCTLMVLVTPEEERALAAVKLACEGASASASRGTSPTGSRCSPEPINRRPPRPT